VEDAFQPNFLKRQAAGILAGAGRSSYVQTPSEPGVGHCGCLLAHRRQQHFSGADFFGTVLLPDYIQPLKLLSAPSFGFPTLYSEASQRSFRRFERLIKM